MYSVRLGSQMSYVSPDIPDFICKLIVMIIYLDFTFLGGGGGQEKRESFVGCIMFHHAVNMC